MREINLMTNVSLSQFPGKDDMERFRAAAAYLRANPGTVLLLEPGIYHLHDPKARQLQEDVMAGKFTRSPEPLMFNYTFEYVSGIDLTGAQDVCIDGQGATLVFDGFMENFTLSRCKNVTLKNFSIDLQRKAYSRGTITGYGLNHSDADFGALPLLSERMPTLRVLIHNESERRFIACLNAKRIRHLGGGKYRFYGMRHTGVGDTLHLTHTYHFRPSILIYEAENTVIEGVAIHSHCGMGVVGHRAKDILLKGLRVVPSADEAMSTNTDATHFVSCEGLLRFEGCRFEGHGDDATNVHTYYHSITKVEKNLCTTQVKAPTGTHSQKLDYFNPGDTLELVGIKDLAPVRTYKVLESRPDFHAMTCAYALDGALPENFADCFLADITQMPRLEFVGCTSVGHRSRSVLVKTRDVLIEDCVFERIDCAWGAAVCVAAEAWWHEGVTSENVTIRGNRIMDCASGIRIGIDAKEPGAFHRNITIENNVIECPAAEHAICASNVDGLILRANRLRSTGQEVLTQNCVNVTTED